MFSRTASLTNFAVALLPLGAIGAVFVLQWKGIDLAVIGVLLIAAFAALIVGAAKPAQTLQIYFAYLCIEGGAKMLSNYNPVIRVGSDLLLLMALARLLARPRPATTGDAGAIGKVTCFMALFWLWVAVQFLNPWGLGLIPSAASLKIYVLPMLTFLIGAYLLTNEEMEAMPFVMLLLGVFEAVIALIDWSLGDKFIETLSPRYAMVSAGKFSGVFYRPFGTTYAPGGPCVWIFYGVMGALMVLRVLDDRKRRDGHASRQSMYWRLLVALFFPLGAATLFACQVRSVLIKTVLFAFLGFSLSSRTRATMALGIGSVAVLVALPFLDDLTSEKGLPKSQVGQAAARLMTLKSQNTWENARSGSLDMMMLLANYTWHGIGLSRVGAASEPWGDLISEDLHFNKDWSFADNAWRALFTEVGIFGLSAYVLLVGALIVLLIGRGHYLGYSTAIFCALTVLAGFGSEGILYSPDASFFWFNAAFALRYVPPPGGGRG